MVMGGASRFVGNVFILAGANVACGLSALHMQPNSHVLLAKHNALLTLLHKILINREEVQ